MHSRHKVKTKELVEAVVDHIDKLTILELEKLLMFVQLEFEERERRGELDDNE
jgi:hypothetical protein